MKDDHILVTTSNDLTPTLSLAVPFYNEAGGITEFFERVVPVLEGLEISYEIVAVNDGSEDATLDELKRERERNDSIKVVSLTRNFGKEAALTAALDHCTGQAVIPIDADLQDPPELIGELLAKWREGYPVVIAQRIRREGESWLKKSTAHGFYRFFNRLSEIPIPPDVGDFRLMDRKVINALKVLGERNRFNKGLFAWVGYRTAIVRFDREGRKMGSSKWNLWKLWNFALDGIFSFSSVPLRIWTYLGATIATGSFAYALFILLKGRDPDAPGYASLMTAILFLGGIQLISLGVLGEYIGRIFKETKSRPVYLVDE